ncbi:MAG: hypothetical protein JW748_10935 [Anaerolineales bacterium]|nr:hypothetical protein [Anaerolineales bacterium]
MPQLAKGGKWVFGWVVVSPRREIRIPPEAYAEYGFQAGETVMFIAGSRTSRGFSIGRPERIASAKIPLENRALGSGKIGPAGTVELPLETGITPGERLLVGRGSGLALGFIRQGPIFQEALKHPELESFSAD